MNTDMPDGADHLQLTNPCSSIRKFRVANEQQTLHLVVVAEVIQQGSRLGCGYLACLPSDVEPSKTYSVTLRSACQKNKTSLLQRGTTLPRTSM